ncbi:MAG TPA: SpoIIE family protein phosphatase [Thermoanaerobaculia bacterium]|nr:SpoIIE family protein phosphatase [Thermoanaerobaculia bacterium]
MKTGGFSRPYKGLSICGDSFVIEEREGTMLVAVIDGLGHGYESSVAAERASEVIRDLADKSVEAILRRCHEELRITRGAAIGVLKVDAEGAGEFCGIGNIEVQSLNGQAPSIFCLAGIVGHNLRSFKVMSVTMKPGDIYCLMSDGISTRGNLKSCLPGPPETVARRIVEHWGREHDDATALVVGFGESEMLADPIGRPWAARPTEVKVK